MKDKFDLKQVTILIDRRDDDKGTYYDMYANQLKSPLCYPCCSRDEAAAMFAKWLENTLAAMNSNNAKRLTIKCKWS